MADEPNPDETFTNVREFLGWLVGARVVDITQHDQEEWVEERRAFVMLHFDTGATITIPIGAEGFDVFDPRDHDGR